MNDVIIGSVSISMIRIVDDAIVFITFIWSCTKFLIPKTNGLLLSYKSKKAMCLYMEVGVSSSYILSW